MAGIFELDPDLKKRLKIGKQQWAEMKGGMVSALDSMHEAGVPTGTAVIDKKRRPGGRGAGVTGDLPAYKATPSIVKPSDRHIVGSSFRTEHQDMYARDNRPPLIQAASETLRRRDAGETLTSPRQGSYIFNKARENIQRRIGGGDVKDPRTGEILESSDWLPAGKAFSSNAWEKTVGGQPNINYDKNAIMPEGYYNEAGTFIHGPRVKLKDLGIGGYSEGLKKQAGLLDPETGRIGSELARRGEQTLANIRGKYKERVANIQAQGGIEQAGILSRGKTTARDPLKPYTGTLTREDETGFKTQIPYSEYTGQPAPGYGSASAELPENVKAHIDKLKNTADFDSWYRSQDENTRIQIRKYLGR